MQFLSYVSLLNFIASQINCSQSVTTKTALEILIYAKASMALIVFEIDNYTFLSVLWSIFILFIDVFASLSA